MSLKKTEDDLMKTEGTDTKPIFGIEEISHQAVRGSLDENITLSR